MGSEWVETRLGDVADLLTGFPFQSRYYTSNASDPRLLGGDNIAQGYLRWENRRNWPSTQTDGLEAYWLREDDVVLAMDRPWIEAGLKRAAVRAEDLPALLVQRTARLRGSSILASTFLRYLLSSYEFTNYVVGVQTGTAVPHISPTQIREFRFRLPPIASQRAIAHILGSLDDKIELNRRTNETLEAMARALLKSWFVDFDPVRAKSEGRVPVGMDAETAKLFPSGFEESSLGPIPSGWAIEQLDSIAAFLNGLALQKYPADNDSHYLPVIKIAQLRSGLTGKTDRASASIPSQYVIEDGDVLFSWSGSLEVVVWTGGRGALNQHLFKVTSARFPPWFYLHWVRHHLPDFRAIAAGKATTMGHIQRHHLSDAKVVVPHLPLMSRLDSLMSPVFNRIVATEIESRTLTTLRDTLLPKLISGEIRIKDAEKLASSAL